jgi:hypothetical protein
MSDEVGSVRFRQFVFQCTVSFVAADAILASEAATFVSITASMCAYLPSKSRLYSLSSILSLLR